MRPARVETIDEPLWDRMYAVNIKSIFLAAKYVVPEMKKAGGGAIINTGSVAGVRPRTYGSACVSPKGAVITLTEVLAVELARCNIRVNYINPVLTETSMVDSMSEESKKVILSTILVGYMAKSEDQAYAALYLASDESLMLTGASINVDGGYGI